MKKNFRSYLALGLTIGVLTAGGGAVYAASTDNSSLTKRLPMENGDFQKGPGMMGTPEDGQLPVGFGIKHTVKAGADFSTLVNGGVISQETADKISAYMKEQQAAREAEMKTLKDSAGDDGNVRFENVKSARIDMFENLVTAGIITQSEADVIKATMPERLEIKHEFFNLDSMVSQGIIDETTLEAIKAYTDSKMEAHKIEMNADMEKLRSEISSEIKSGIPPQPPAISEPNITINRIDIFEELVNEGIITQEQSDAIKAAMPAPPELPQ